MATVRDIERLLGQQGAANSKLDTVLRKLREDGRLPVLGRGLNAPSIGAAEVSSIIIAYSGSLNSVSAADRLRKLENIRSQTSGDTLATRVGDLLTDPSDIHELRISRTHRRARIIKKDGTVERFSPTNAEEPVGRFAIEGIFDGELLRVIAGLLSGSSTTGTDEDLGGDTL